MRRKQERLKEGISRIFLIDEMGKKHEPRRGRFQAARWVVLHGEKKREYKWCRSFDEAKAFAAMPIEDVSPRAKGMTFGELWRRYDEVELSQRSRSTRVKRGEHYRHLRSLSEIEVEAITPTTIDDLLVRLKAEEYLANQHSTRLSYANEMKLLKAMLRFYISRVNYRFPFPVLPQHAQAAKVRKAKKVDKAISRADFELMLAAMESAVRSRTDRMVLTIAKVQFALFARIGEIAALEVGDYSAASSEVRLTKRLVWVRKKGEPDYVDRGLKASDEKATWSPKACSLLTEWALLEGIWSGPLFLDHGRPIKYRDIQYRYDKACKRAGLGYTGTHILRHGSLTAFQAEVGDLNLTRQVAGHSDIRMTQRYAKPSQDRIREAIERMESQTLGGHQSSVTAGK